MCTNIFCPKFDFKVTKSGAISVNVNVNNEEE